MSSQEVPHLCETIVVLVELLVLHFTVFHMSLLVSHFLVLAKIVGACLEDFRTIYSPWNALSFAPPFNGSLISFIDQLCYSFTQFLRS